MATKKSAKASAKAKSSKPAKTSAKTSKKVVKAKTKRVAAPGLFDGLKPLKKSFTETQLIERGVEKAGIERKQVKAVHGDLQKVFAASAMKGGVNKVKLLGMIFTVVHVPAKKMPAVKKGTMVKGFGGVEVKSPGKAAYVKPARFRVRVRITKKLKDAILGA